MAMEVQDHHARWLQTSRSVCDEWRLPKGIPHVSVVSHIRTKMHKLEFLPADLGLFADLH